MRRHSAEVEEICRCARREMALEEQMQGIVEEWTEQILSFHLDERRRLHLLDVPFTEHLLGISLFF